MNVIKTKLSGVLIFEPKVFHDSRGYFFESWNKISYNQLGLKTDFVQDNVSFSYKNILRGLHIQNPNSQGKLVSVLKGSVYDVAVDLRLGSPTYGKWLGEILSQENQRQLYIPPGFAHGFLVLSDECLFNYKCTDYYNPLTEYTLLWNDPDLGISWPIQNTPPIVSEKDNKGYKFKNFPCDRLLSYNTIL